jgi:hypothetical protein
MRTHPTHPSTVFLSDASHFKYLIAAVGEHSVILLFLYSLELAMGCCLIYIHVPAGKEAGN